MLTAKRIVAPQFALRRDEVPYEKTALQFWPGSWHL